jgi:dihydroflavonol-4-reductase
VTNRLEEDVSNHGDKPVLVTGASGFVGMHCTLRLLSDGYLVRGTVRSPERAEAVKSTLAKYVDVGKLSFAYTDLNEDQGWEEAIRGCSRLFHVASPVPRQPPKTADEVIKPARDGALRVLKAAAKVGVERVVMTSSTAAVIWGKKRDGSKIFNESDWSVLNDEVGPYEQSKTLAERAAWQFVEEIPKERRFDLVTIAPGVILGPVLGAEFSISGEIVRKVLTAELPGCPDLGFATVDVRDVANAHVLAMNCPEAANQRFIVALEHVPWLQIAQILHKHYAPRGFKVPQRRLPNWVLKCVSLFDKTAAVVVPELGKRQDVSCERARRVLGWKPRDVETMVIDMAESMIQQGIVKAPKKARVSAVEPASQTR